MRISDWSSDVCSSDLFDSYATHLNNALDSVRANGEIVCRINADADPTNDDAACAPIDPFGNVTASQAALDYATVLSGSPFQNVPDHFLATLRGDLFNLPSGLATFSFPYSHPRASPHLFPFN